MVEQRAIECVAAHQLLSLCRQRLRLLVELGRLGLREQPAYLRQDLLLRCVDSVPRPGKSRRARRRQHAIDFWQGVAHREQLDDHGQCLMAAPAVACRPLTQLRAAKVPPDPPLDLVELRDPARIDQLVGVVGGHGSHRIDQVGRAAASERRRLTSARSVGAQPPANMPRSRRAKIASTARSTVTSGRASSGRAHSPAGTPRWCSHRACLIASAATMSASGGVGGSAACLGP